MFATIVPIAKLTHVHVTSSSRDCDGRYDHDEVLTPTGRDDFRSLWEYLTSSTAAISSNPEQKIARGVTSDGYPILDMLAIKEEGFSHKEYIGCDDPRCDLRAYRQRDHSAEAAGY